MVSLGWDTLSSPALISRTEWLAVALGTPTLPHPTTGSSPLPLPSTASTISSRGVHTRWTLSTATATRSISLHRATLPTISLKKPSSPLMQSRHNGPPTRFLSNAGQDRRSTSHLSTIAPIATVSLSTTSISLPTTTHSISSTPPHSLSHHRALSMSKVASLHQASSRLRAIRQNWSTTARPTPSTIATS